MSYLIFYKEKAVKEYESAIEWYRQNSENAATNFQIAVKERTDQLRINPVSFKKTYKRFHEISLKKYPFSIIYLINERNKQVVISSIFHHKRNPRQKFKK